MKKFSEIPMRTWNWLGVNEVSTEVESEEKNFIVNANESKKISEVNLSKNSSAKKIHVTVEENANIDLIVVDLSENDSFNEIIVDLNGDNSKANITAAYFCFGDNKLDLNYIINQRGKKTDATMDVKGALNGHCDKIFRGTLNFEKGTKGSIGREKEEVIVLSDEVRNRSVPLMLSHEDEVDGHHAVSIGRIDEEKLFYLMSRGLDKIESEKLIVEAAFNPVINLLDDEELIKKISEVIERRLIDVEK